jgi:hypothetical protein
MSNYNPSLRLHLYPNISVVEMTRLRSRVSTKFDTPVPTTPVRVKAVILPALGVCVRI